MTPEEEPRLTTPGVLGIGLGVLTIAAAAAGLLRSSVPELGAEAASSALARHFTVAGEVPFGFTVHGLRRMPRGELYVRLAVPGELPAEPDPLPFEGEVAEGGKGRGGWGGSDERTEWEKVAIGDPAPPVEASFLLVEDDKERGDEILERQFAHVRFRDIEDLDADGSSVPIDSGHLDWGSYETSWVHHRHYEKADGVPTFHDTLRVNLSTGRDARVLYVRWPRGTPGDVEAARELLDVYRPREADA